MMHSTANTAHALKVTTLDQFEPQPGLPWLLLKDYHHRVNYWLGSAIKPSSKDLYQDEGIRLSFSYPISIKVGTALEIGIPLPDSFRHYQAEVVSCDFKEGEYEMGLIIRIESELDFLTMTRSSDFLSLRPFS